MITNSTTEIKQHTLDEIKPSTRKLNMQRANLNSLNSKLRDAQTSDDPFWATHQANLYLKLLPLVHIKGTAGSLLPQAACPELPQAVQ
jgi:hypothetical protein